MPFVVWSGAIATAHEKHCEDSLTCSMSDDSSVHADNLDWGNSCNTFPVCVWPLSRTVHEPTGVITDQIHRAAI